jgi:hypothetical protein
MFLLGSLDGPTAAQTGGWKVEDASGQALAWVYGEDRPQGASSRVLTVDEARRIAVNIARLQDLLWGDRALAASQMRATGKATRG